MRSLIAICVLFLFPGPVNAQVLSKEDIIRRVIETGTFEGQMQKQIGDMGDAAAVVVTRVVSGRNLRPTEIDMILLILTWSFADPSGVKVVSDREPRAALFVLRNLESYTTDPALRERIAHTRNYVLTKTRPQGSPKKSGGLGQVSED
jgi:hypothetical protein